MYWFVHARLFYLDTYGVLVIPVWVEFLLTWHKGSLDLHHRLHVNCPYTLAFNHCEPICCVIGDHMQVQLDRHNGYIRISVHSVCQNLRIITTYVHAYVSCGDNSEPSFARDIASRIVLQMLLQLLNKKT